MSEYVKGYPFNEFHEKMEMGAAMLTELHDQTGSPKPSRKVVMRFPYEFTDEHGNFHPAGELIEITIWTKISKANKRWFPGGVTQVGKWVYLRLIGIASEASTVIKRYLASDNGKSQPTNSMGHIVFPLPTEAGSED